ncbi:MAG TPA: glycoside hydrolase family 2 TIM barrel-domain containing protein [Cytophagales bacterium]|nr:glycoside hydrolase family 2 TIM barrel-domain containing protein [Cytophagales bacterium]
MHKTKLFLILLFVWSSFSTNAQWKPAGDKIKTDWAGKINPSNVLNEYPRPIMDRGEWMNLNGLWDYTITSVGEALPSDYSGKILVPFPVESSLSGVMKTVGEGNELVYRRTFDVPAKWKGKNILLHFGAVDWKADVWVNEIKAGTHTGGYAPFSFDITPLLNKTGSQKLVVRVWDPTDEGYQPRGKQVKKPEAIWYTPVTGIWQTVWLEPVPENYISKLNTTPDLDKSRVNIEVLTEGQNKPNIIEVKVFDGKNQVATSRSLAGQPLELQLSSPKIWSPESPFLYNTEVSIYSNGKLVDRVKSYFGMRKISTKRDENGIVRIQLNNKDYFQFGPLDQGWWPDGLYTAPTDEALIYDIKKTKDLGFNMIRKHVKVEPARWYTHCDRMGILVWQDMPSGDEAPIWQMRKYFEGQELQRSAESEANFRKEWKEIMDYLHSYPSIVTWVPFNEAWGQFKTKEIVEWTKQYDPSRLVNPASGGNHFPVGDMLDLHNYPGPSLYLYDAQRPTVLGEYGGIGLALEGHLWEPKRNWGYVQFKSSDEVTDEYVKYAEELKQLIKAGFSAAVYTQTTDVEIEVNGFMTYDRKVIKMNEERVRKINQEVINILNKE